MKGDLSNRDYERFSAYLDGQLSPTEQTRLEKDLKARPELRLALEEISATRQVLRKATVYRAPRNFTLSPEVARQAAPRTFFPNLGFRFSTAIAAVAFAAVMLLQILPAGLTQNTAVLEAVRVPAPQAALPAQDLAQSTPTAQVEAFSKAAGQTQNSGAAATQSAPIIVWASPVAGLGGGGDASALRSAAGAGPLGNSGNGIVTYNGVPPAEPPAEDGMAAQPPAAAAAAPQPTQTEGTNQALEGGGPVSGLPEQGSAGQVIDQSSANANTSVEAPVRGNQTALGLALTERQTAQVILIAVALAATVGAVILRRRR